MPTINPPILNVGGTERGQEYTLALTVERVKRRAMRFLRQRLTEWFMQQLEEYFPERGGRLIESYEHEWYKGLSQNDFMIASDLIYAERVNKLGPGTDWTKDGTISGHATFAGNFLVQILPTLANQCFQEALMLETGRFSRY